MITIRPVTTIEHCHQIQEIERAAWGGDSAVPVHILITLAHQKGVGLIAYDEAAEGRPIGFCFSFVSFTGPNRTLKHHSHMAGVLPGYQGRGIGAQLKWAQRQAVLDQGIERMTWTYDPLQTKNGRLNLFKLGAVCQTYKRNVYGMMNDGLNAGIETDRFQVDWWLASDHVEAHHQSDFAHQSSAAWVEQGGIIANPITQAGPLWPGEVQLDRFDQTRPVLIAVPSDYQAVKQADLAAAIAWRSHTAPLFETGFDKRYVATDLIREGDVSYYVLEPNWVP